MAARVTAKESDVQASCLDYLAMRGVFAFRLNNIPVPMANGFRTLPKHTPKGLPDAIAIRPKTGTIIALEFKGTKGTQSEDQERIQRRITENGGEYHIIRSIDDVQHIGL